jgi:hypothetical protein
MRDALLRMVLYFDIFKHPLTVAELERLVAPGQRAAVEAALTALESEGCIAATGPYRHLPGARHNIARRQERARTAEQVWPHARRAAAVLGALPFVRGVLITGSLSKSSALPGDDVDFLLLVQPGRVWSLKTITHVARKAMPESLRELFCTNYLLDVDHLSLDQRNLFTAVELCTAVPMFGPEACAGFLAANRWAEHFVPGMSWSLARADNARRQPRLRPVSAVEAVWRGPLADQAERRALRLWDRYWRRKYDWLSDAQRDRRFQREESVATNHLHDFQEYVLREANKRMAQAGLVEPVVL